MLTKDRERKLIEAEFQMVERGYGAREDQFELKRMAMVFSLEKKEFVKWSEVLNDLTKGRRSSLWPAFFL